VASPDAKIAVQSHGGGGLPAVGHSALAATLAQHQRDVQVQVKVRELEVCQLAPAGAGIEQEHLPVSRAFPDVPPA
jgi:hypothetical protein